MIIKNTEILVNTLKYTRFPIGLPIKFPIKLPVKVSLKLPFKVPPKFLVIFPIKVPEKPTIKFPMISYKRKVPLMFPLQALWISSNDF